MFRFLKRTRLDKGVRMGLCVVLSLVLMAVLAGPAAAVVAPSATTDPATEVMPNSATFNGTVNAQGMPSA